VPSTVCAAFLFNWRAARASELLSEYMRYGQEPSGDIAAILACFLFYIIATASDSLNPFVK
jgi:hypothetical protein